MGEFGGFTPATQRFFRSLAKNNNKQWFEEHRSIYEQSLREPMKALIEALDARLGSFAPEIVGDPKRSLFRINRDIRFSKDKSPYKTNAGCWLYHRDAGRGVGQDADAGGAGYYFHLDGKASFVAGGIWMPARPVLNKIRDRIADNPAALRKILAAKPFATRFGPPDRESQLTRIPRGFPADHPDGDLLRLQSFTVGRAVPLSMLGSTRLVTRLADDFAVMLPLVRWLNDAIGFKRAVQR